MFMNKNNDIKVQFTFKDVQEGSPDYIKIAKDIPDEIIYNFYLGFYPSLSKKFKSPFREEKDGSFCFFINNGKVLFKCFSTGNHGDSLQLVQSMYSLDYIKAAKKICLDIKNIKEQVSEYKKLPKEDTKKAIIEVILKEHTEEDINYWKQYYLPINTIKNKYDIKPCKQVWLNDKLYYTYKDNNPAYRFKIGNSYKIYCPLTKNKKTKWLSNYNINSIQGFKQLNYDNDTLIITKSYRDVIVLNEFYNKSAIALNAEGNYIPDKWLEYFKSKFKNIVCFYDNDEAGINYMDRNKEVYGFEYFRFKEYLLELGIKDISDYIKQYGVLSFEDIKEDLIGSNKYIKKLI